MKKRNILAVVMSSLCLVSLAGCKSETHHAKADQETKTQIYHNYGEDVAIDYEPEHVITMGPNTTELFCALGLDKKVTGDCLNNHSRGALKKYKMQYDSIPELTHGAPTREAVLGSDVDFIYGIDWAFGDEGVKKDELTEAKIPTYVNKAQTFEEEYKEIMDMGRIFHVENKAKEIVNQQKTRIHHVKQQVKGQKKTRVLVYDSGGNGIFTATGHNFEDQLINAAGGINIFNDIKNKEWTTVSSEEAVKRNPEVIIIHDYDSPSVKEKIKAIEHDPALKQCTAVKEKRFVIIPLEAVLPGVRMANTVETFAHAFHPTKVAQPKEE